MPLDRLIDRNGNQCHQEAEVGRHRAIGGRQCGPFPRWNANLLLHICQLCGLALGSGLPSLAGPVAGVVAATATAVASPVPVLVGLVLPILGIHAST